MANKNHLNSDGLEFLSWIGQCSNYRFLSSYNGAWIEHINFLTNYIENNSDIDFTLMLGREDQDLDEFVIYAMGQDLNTIKRLLSPFIKGSQHMTNLEKIYAKAEDVLGDAERAEEWVQKMSATLGAKPIDLAATDEGTQQVLLHLNSISRHSAFDL